MRNIRNWPLMLSVAACIAVPLAYRADAFDVWPLVILAALLPLLFFLFRLMRSMGDGGAGGAMKFGQSKVKRENPKDLNVRFDDVIGVEEAKREVKEYLDYARDPQRFMRFGAEMPSGIMLIGPTGCGKTMLAKALACEAGVPFFSISGSDFVEMFVGVGAARVRNTMTTVSRSAPSILFIDEIDAVGRQRGAGFGNQNDEREQTLNQILVELDGISSAQGVMVVAATNRPDVLDPALMRPGRFDRKVYLPAPDVVGRQAILESYARTKPLAPDVDFSVLAKLTFNANGADLKNLVNEAAITAARRDALAIEMVDFETALDKIELGTERRITMVPDEKRRVAVHEAGHAVVATVTKGSSVRKVTVIPRNMALGLTHTLPEEDRYLATEDELVVRMQVLFGGRIAEKLIYGDYSTGASDDLKRATLIARDMVMRFGMSEKVGPVVHMEEQGPVYLGQTFEELASHSEETLREIDQEIKRLLSETERKTVEILGTHASAVEAIADELTDHETIDGEKVRAIIAPNA